jgi:sigma-B regulation protein RsbU (phosphoserine phosphatase)
MFVTVFLAVVNLKDGACVFARGGHNPPLLLRADGAVEVLPAIDGPVVGVMEDAEFAEATTTIQPGDTLFAYTDGVTEAMDVADEMFGLERTAAELSRVEGRSCEQLIHDIRGALETHAGGAPQSDDITMLALRLLATVR